MRVRLALAASELPLALIERFDLTERLHDRGGEKEFWFYSGAQPMLLPVWWAGRMHVVKWGNQDRADPKLPASGWTWEERVKAGWWSALAPEPVVVPATSVYAHGVWAKVKEGVRGLLVHDHQERPVVFLLSRPATRYYEIMTRTDWMPVLVDEVI